jgi:membrane protease YdiL (CAAX protease family)
VLRLEENRQAYQSKLTVRAVNVIYLVVMVLFITIGNFVQARGFNSGILITEFVVIALPAFVYIILKKGKLKKELRLNRLGLLSGVLVVFAFLFSYPVAMFLNLIGNLFVSLFGPLMKTPVPIPDNFNEFFILLMIVAGSAGICEELLFRGLVMRGYEKAGKWPAIVFTAVLFAGLHLNIQNFFGPLFLGILLGYVVYTTDSVFAGMIGHFTNNAFSVALSFLLMNLPFMSGAAPEKLPPGAEFQALLLAAIPIGMFAAFSGAMGFLCLWGLKELNRERLQAATLPEKQNPARLLANGKLSWPLYVCAVIFVFFSLLQLACVATGQSLGDMIF